MNSLIVSASRVRTVVELERYNAVAFAFEQFVKVLHVARGLAVNCDDKVSDLCLHARLCQRRAEAFLPVLARKDFCDVEIAGRISSYLSAEQPSIRARDARSFGSSLDVDVTCHQFASHFG